MHKDQEGCMCILGSMTEALRAGRILAKEAIPTNTVKADTGKRGCAYALSFSCAQQNNVQRILQKNGVRVKEFRGGSQA